MDVLHSPTVGEISKALAAAQAEIKNAALNKENPYYSSKYADLASIRDAVVPALAKQQIAVTQFTALGEHGFVLVTRLSHASGEWMQGVYPLAQGAPQAMGSALTYARRYALAAAGGIAAEEDDDGNAAQAAGMSAKAKAAGAAKGNGAAPASGADDDDKAARMAELEKTYPLEQEEEFVAAIRSALMDCESQAAVDTVRDDHKEFLNLTRIRNPEGFAAVQKSFVTTRQRIKEQTGDVSHEAQPAPQQAAE